MDTKNMTLKHEIEIPGLPEGWRAVAYRTPVKNVDCVLDSNRNVIRLCDWSPSAHKWLIVEKIKPRRIVLEETDEPNSNADMQEFSVPGASIQLRCSRKYRRVIEE